MEARESQLHVVLLLFTLMAKLPNISETQNTTSRDPRPPPLLLSSGSEINYKYLITARLGAAKICSVSWLLVRLLRGY